MWRAAAILCFILAVITDFVELSPGLEAVRQPLLGPSVQWELAAMGQLPPALLARSLVSRLKARKLPTITLLGANNYVCQRGKGHTFTNMKRGINYPVLLDTSKTKILGIIRNNQLCPLVIYKNMDPRTNKHYYDPVELEITNDMVSKVLGGNFLEDQLKPFFGMESLVPYIRQAKIPI